MVLNELIASAILSFFLCFFCVVAHHKARLPDNGDFPIGLHLVSAGGHDIVNMFNQNFTTEYMEGAFGKIFTVYGLAVRVRHFSFWSDLM